MIELNKKGRSVLKTGRLPADNEIISIKECRGYFNSSKVSDKAIRIIRNNLVGVVDSLINTYLEDFR